MPTIPLPRANAVPSTGEPVNFRSWQTNNRTRRFIRLQARKYSREDDLGIQSTDQSNL